MNNLVSGDKASPPPPPAQKPVRLTASGSGVAVRSLLSFSLSPGFSSYGRLLLRTSRRWLNMLPTNDFSSPITRQHASWCLERGKFHYTTGTQHTEALNSLKLPTTNHVLEMARLNDSYLLQCFSFWFAEQSVTSPKLKPQIEDHFVTLATKLNKWS